MKVRCRMAPSPTGEYHIGHIRTLLYNYAWAKKNNGQLILRIEDTDRERYVEGAVDRILEVITDYGVSWDEGPRIGGPHEPYYQSQRLDLYCKYAIELVRSGKAYYCFCTKERLETLRKQQEKDHKLPGYDRHCRNIRREESEKRVAAGEPYVIRMKVPDNEEISFEDFVQGEVTVNSSVLDDQILLKSDGYPTYHLAVVVDDHLMEITHIIRGNEWISSTPKHVLLYRFFGWDMPKVGHLPVFLDPSGEGKMSKRRGSVSARSFLEAGYLPEALDNYLILLGWNPGTERELFTLQEFTSAFDLNHLNKSNPRFTYEKLKWFNQQYIRSLDNVTLAKRLEKFTSREEAEIAKVLPLVKERMVTLRDFDRLTDYFFEEPKGSDDIFAKVAGISAQVLDHAIKTLSENWDGKVLEENARAFCAEKNIKVGDYFMVLRIAITGKAQTPPLWDVMEILGKDEIVSRLGSSLLLVD
ncbi:glutamate--tRNA ligase [Candidatus Gottesmanbacteria bacterium RIFCSPHIGHO2_01_FULL_47_48]|uniref:Glutamate--tRNA ligase n=1 Tax=Candidatus Gottesmanbacteria bacterium RIFCSPHIGHO2_01_FULL_47_48 TaxID=1798381 RepID=A0A1F6A329_9BACT|nr:MAG: glutamate--tRNA ligase [Candidatus Gottesmanbacteria bacterium RIFCSPHIGHO2_01_FULL_47_48]